MSSSSPIIYFKGKILSADQGLSFLNRGFLFGESIFTSLRSKGKFLPFFPDHLERLQRSWFYLFPTTPPNEWLEFLKKLLLGLRRIIKIHKIHNSGDFYLRISLWAPFSGQKINLLSYLPKIEFMILSYPLNNGENQPVLLKLSKFKFLSHSGKPSFLKIPNYLLGNYERRKLGSAGGLQRDLFYLNEVGQITEATTSNIFIIKEGIIYTPKLSSGVLAGVTRKNLIKCLRENNFKVVIKNISLVELQKADEIFLTNAVRGITPAKFINPNNLKKRHKKLKISAEIHSIFSNYQLRFLYDKF